LTFVVKTFEEKNIPFEKGKSISDIEEAGFFVKGEDGQERVTRQPTMSYKTRQSLETNRWLSDMSNKTLEQELNYLLEKIRRLKKEIERYSPYCSWLSQYRSKPDKSNYPDESNVMLMYKIHTALTDIHFLEGHVKSFQHIHRFEPNTFQNIHQHLFQSPVLNGDTVMDKPSEVNKGPVLKKASEQTRKQQQIDVLSEILKNMIKNPRDTILLSRVGNYYKQMQSEIPGLIGFDKKQKLSEVLCKIDGYQVINSGEYSSIRKN
jgi:hypothetical protein